MFQDAYTKCDRLETEELLKVLGPHLDGAAFPPETTVIMARPLPFYPGYRFYDLADHTTMPARRRFLIVKDRDVLVIDFTNAPLYALNARAPVKLTSTTMPEYIRFFFSFVRGRHGRFMLCESIDDVHWRDDPAPAARKAIAKLLQPLELKATDEDGTVHYACQMIFKDTLFQTSVAIRGDGLVTLSDEHLLVEDMPVMEDLFGH